MTKQQNNSDFGDERVRIGYGSVVEEAKNNFEKFVGTKTLIPEPLFTEIEGVIMSFIISGDTHGMIDISKNVYFFQKLIILAVMKRNER